MLQHYDLNLNSFQQFCSQDMSDKISLISMKSSTCRLVQELNSVHCDSHQLKFGNLKLNIMA